MATLNEADCRGIHALHALRRPVDHSFNHMVDFLTFPAILNHMVECFNFNQPSTG